MASVVSSCAAAGIPHALDGFGCLLPRKEQRQVLGVLFSSAMFDGRAAPGHALPTSVIGGKCDPVLPCRPEVEIAAIAHAEHAALLGARKAPLFKHATC